MSSYTTIALLQNRISPANLAQMADDTTTTTITTTAEAAASLALSGTTANINQAISDASALIDSWLIGAFDMTDADLLGAVEMHCANIALYRLAQRRFMSDESNPYYASYRDSIAWLKGKARGDMPKSTELGGTSQITYKKTVSDRTLDSDSMSEYV